MKSLATLLFLISVSLANPVIKIVDDRHQNTGNVYPLVLVSTVSQYNPSSTSSSNLNQSLDIFMYDGAGQVIGSGNQVVPFDSLDISKFSASDPIYQCNSEQSCGSYVRVYLLNQNQYNAIVNIGVGYTTESQGSYTRKHYSYGIGYPTINPFNILNYLNSVSNFIEIRDWNKTIVADLYDYGPNNFTIMQNCVGGSADICLSELALGPSTATAMRISPQQEKITYNRANHVVNGSFENGLDSWSEGGPILIGENSTTVDNNPEVIDSRLIMPRDGKQIVAVNLNTSNQLPLHALNQNIQLQSNHSYRLSYYYKAPDLNPLNNYIRTAITQADNLRVLGPFLNQAKDWQYYEMYFQPNVNGTSSVVSLLDLAAMGSATNVSIMIDNVELLDVTSQAQLSNTDLITQDIATQWTMSGDKIIYVINPFGSIGKPYIMGNVNSWFNQTGAGASQMKEIDASCGLWAFDYGQSTADNFEFYTSNPQGYFFSYWLDGLHSGGHKDDLSSNGDPIYFQPPQGNSLWIVPSDWGNGSTPWSQSQMQKYIATNNDFSNTLGVSKAIVSETVPASIQANCQVTSIQSLPKNAIYSSEPIGPYVVYVQSPWKDANGNYVPPNFTGTDNGGITPPNSTKTQMTLVDQTCGLYAYQLATPPSPTLLQNFYLYHYTPNSSYQTLSNAGSSQNGIVSFNFPANSVNAVYVTPTVTSSATMIGQVSTTLPASLSDCQYTTIQQVAEVSDDSLNPRMSDIKSIYNYHGSKLYVENIQPGKRLVTISHVDENQHTINTLLPLVMPPRGQMDDLFPDSVTASNQSIAYYGDRVGQNGNPLVGNYVWINNQFSQDPLQRPVASNPPGYAWNANGSMSSVTVYGCAQLVGNDQVTGYMDTTSINCNNLLSSAADIDDNSIYYKYTATMSTQGDGWTMNFKNSKDSTIEVQRRASVPAGQSRFSGKILAQTDNIYDQAGHLIKVIHPIGPDGTRQQTLYDYDPVGRLYEEHTPDIGVKRMVYNDLGHPRFTYEPRSPLTPDGYFPVSYIKYDNLARPIETGYYKFDPGTFVADTDGNGLAQYLVLYANNSTQDLGVATVLRSKLYYDSCHALTDACVGPASINPIIFASPTIANAFKGIYSDWSDVVNDVANIIASGSTPSNPIYMVASDSNITPQSGSDIVPPSGMDLQPIIALIGNRPTGDFYSILVPLLDNATNQMAFAVQRAELIGKTTRVEYYNTESINGHDYGNSPIVESYDYDMQGNKVKTKQVIPWLAGTTENVQVVKADYDEFLNRVTTSHLYTNNGEQEIYSESPQYDAMGRVMSVVNNNGNPVLQNVYDDFGHVIKKSIFDQNNNAMYEYYTWHPISSALLNHYAEVEWSGNTGMQNQIWQERLTYEDAVTGQARYDGLISGMSFTRTDNTTAKLTPTYDQSERLVSIADYSKSGSDLSLAMDYFTDGSLKSLVREAFDNNGNQILTTGNDYSYYPGKHSLMNVSGNSEIGMQGRITDGTLDPTGNNQNFVYDTKGRMIMDNSKGMTVSWRSDDDLPSGMSLLGVNPANNPWNRTPSSVDFLYAGSSRAAKFLYDVTSSGSKIVETRLYTLGGKEVRLDADGNIRSMFLPIASGSGRRTILTQNSTTKDELMVKDHLGSTVRSWTLQGTLAAPVTNLAVDYDAWGYQTKTIEGAGEELAQRFTGKEKDQESGLDYFGARYYDAQLGTWISPDAARQFPNLYSYAGNGFNPLNATDKDGKTLDQFKQALNWVNEHHPELQVNDIVYMCGMIPIPQVDGITLTSKFVWVDIKSIEDNYKGYEVAGYVNFIVHEALHALKGAIQTIFFDTEQDHTDIYNKAYIIQKEYQDMEKNNTKTILPKSPVIKDDTEN